MKRFKIICIALLCSAFTVFATSNESDKENAFNHVDKNKVSEQQRINKQKYQTQRLKYLVNVAKLDQSEEEWLNEVLIQYDTDRTELWIRMNAVRDQVESNLQQGTVNGKIYKDALDKIISYQNQMYTVQTELAKKLINKLPPEKAYKVYNGIREHQNQLTRPIHEN